MKKYILIISIAMALVSCNTKNPSDIQLNQSDTVQMEQSASTAQLPDMDDDNNMEENLSGEVITISSSQFIDQICDVNNPKGFAYKGHTPCLVDFYAGWCGPCMKLKPTVEEIAKEYKGKLIVYTINVDRAQDVCEALGIQNIPTLLLFSRTAQPRKIVGLVSKPELQTAINGFLSE
ncbi:MAG: thioredoxin family protein [Bacteroidales bacterium]|nr:thioredoxin family protein [Bacteroidales bacterium]